jgi:PAS domain S-box-containing protein
LIVAVEPGLPIFGPASGLSVGALIALGPRARLPVAVAVFVASIACGLSIGRNAGLSIAFGFLNTVQALLTAWLLERWFGRTFKLVDVQRVLGFFTATAVGTAITAVGAAAAISLVKPTASPLHVWGLWFAASSLGVVTVAPLLIGLGDAMRERLPRHDLIEGWAALIILTAITVFLISLPDGPWATALPEAVVFPFLLWIAIRCRPVFAGGAALVVGLTVIGSIALNVGNFDWGKPLADRILSAQTFVFIESILVVLLAAVFAERRRNEQRLQLAHDGAVLGAFSADLANGQFECDLRAAQFHGHSMLPTTIKESRRFVHRDDLKRIDGAVAEAHRTRGNWKAEYRVLPPSGHPHAGETRWVAVEGSVVRDAHGAPMQLLGVTRDITLTKRAEQALYERSAQLALAGKAALVGSYAYDVKTRMLQFSEGYAAIYDLPDGTSEMRGSELRALVHPEDLEHLDRVRRQAFEQRRSEFSLVYRNILPKRGVRWIESRSLILYDSNGRPERLVGVNIDVTERRRMEQALTDRNRQLHLAGKTALVGSFVIDIDAAREDFSSQRIKFSPGFAAIYGLSEGIVEISLGDWRSLVHPDDLPPFLEHRQQLFAERRGEHHAEFRIVHPCGSIRWIEARSSVEYDRAGLAKRLVGVNIDITERKRAEEARTILNAELDHRVKNALSTVTAVISQTRQGTRLGSDFAAALEGRIRSMAATHDLLSSRHWQELSLIELIRRELAPYAASNNTEIEGPAILLKPEAGQAMAMVFHELATNAAKYGALCTSNGRVSMRWYQRLNEQAQQPLVLEWQEIGGPPVVAPGRPGYGTSTIRDLIPYEFGGMVDYVLAPEGVRCRIELPADWVRSTAEFVSRAPK